MEDRILKLLINRVAGFIVFLLVLVLLNIFITYIDFPLIKEIVIFFNSQVFWLGVILLLMVLGEIFMMLNFPFNLPGPLFNAAGSVFIIYFILDIFNLITMIGGITLPNVPFNLIFEAIAILVCVVILVTGYISVFKSMPRGKVVIREENKRRREEIEEEDREEKINEAERHRESKKEEKQAKLPIKKKVKRIKVRE